MADVMNADVMEPGPRADGLLSIVKLTDCRLFSVFPHEAKPLKLRRAGIDNLLRFRSESG